MFCLTERKPSATTPRFLQMFCMRSAADGSCSAKAVGSQPAVRNWSPLTVNKQFAITAGLQSKHDKHLNLTNCSSHQPQLLHRNFWKIGVPDRTIGLNNTNKNNSVFSWCYHNYNFTIKTYICFLSYQVKYSRNCNENTPQFHVVKSQPHRSCISSCNNNCL